MDHAKTKTPWNDPMIGLRAAHFIDRMPGRFLIPRPWKIGIPIFTVNRWRKGERPLMRDLFKLAENGADLHYIITGRRLRG